MQNSIGQPSSAPSGTLEVETHRSSANTQTAAGPCPAAPETVDHSFACLEAERCLGLPSSRVGLRQSSLWGGRLGWEEVGRCRQKKARGWRRD